MSRLSIIIPVRNESRSIHNCLASLATLREHGHEVIVVDGYSSDGTWECLQGKADLRLQAGPGRAVQMNAGAARAGGDILLFLHADTRLPEDAESLILAACTTIPAWGRFDVRLSGRVWAFRMIAVCMNLRSRWTGIATGDQALFMSRQLFCQVGGFPELPLMEDIVLSKLLRARTWPVCLHQTVLTSSRRWEQNGVWRTILLMWAMRLAYFIGVSPARLARHYHG